MLFFGGLEGSRTPDPHNANVVRSQLRYKPVWENYIIQGLFVKNIPLLEKPEFTELRFLFSCEQPFDAGVVCGNISQIVADRRACHRKDNGHDPFPQAIYLIAILEYIGND